MNKLRILLLIGVGISLLYSLIKSHRVADARRIAR